MASPPGRRTGECRAHPAGRPAPHGAFTVRMAFYGNEFHRPDHQGLEPEPLTAAEQPIAEQLALDLLRSAAHSSNQKDAGKHAANSRH